MLEDPNVAVSAEPIGRAPPSSWLQCSSPSGRIVSQVALSGKAAACCLKAEAAEWAAAQARKAHAGVVLRGRLIFLGTERSP